MNQLLGAVPSSKNTTKNEAAVSIMHHLGMMYENDFLKVAMELGYGPPIKKMDAVSAAAIWDKANIGNRAQ